jgi:hypothetical protein
VTGRVFTCAIYPSHTWYDVRLMADGVLVYSQVASSIDRAREVALLWRRTLMAGGRYSDREE